MVVAVNIHGEPAMTALPDDDTPYLAHSIRRACRISGLGKSFLYEILARGELPSIKIGKRRLIADADLRAFLVAHRVTRKSD